MSKIKIAEKPDDFGLIFYFICVPEKKIDLNFIQITIMKLYAFNSNIKKKYAFKYYITYRYDVKKNYSTAKFHF